VPAKRGSKWLLLGGVVSFLLVGSLGFIAIAFGLFAFGMTTDFVGNPIPLGGRLPWALAWWVVGAAFVTLAAVVGYRVLRSYLKPPRPPLPYDPTMGFHSHLETRDG
jgi:membrane protein implicated in regulation of membrane protease activity